MDYPVLNKYTFLNTAASGLISQELYDVRREWDKNMLYTGSDFLNSLYDDIEKIRASVSDFLDADGYDVSLIPSLSYGINLLLEGARFNKDILMLEDDYPSLVWPFRTRGYAMDQVFKQADWSLDRLLSTIDEAKSTAFAFSPVIYQSGHYISPEWIKAIRSQFPELLLLMDGTQFIGTQPFSAKEFGVDLLIGSGYKWLGAGFGNAYVAISPRLKERLQPRSDGYNSVKKHDFSVERTIQGRLEPGHQDMTAFLSLRQGMSQISSIGLVQVENHIKQLRLAVETRMNAIGHVDIMSYSAPHIVSIPGKLEEVQKLAERSIICSYRDGIRLSYHHYNSVEDINRFFDGLSDIRR